MIRLRKSLSAMAVALFLAGSARSSWAQNDLDRSHGKGELLGRGWFKETYRDSMHPEHVLSIQTRPSWRAGLAELELERDVLLELETSFGLPVEKIVEIGTFGGNPAYVKRLAWSGTKPPDGTPPDGPGYNAASWQQLYEHLEAALNEKSDASLRKIRRILASKRLDLKDSQFLVYDDGEVVVADPDTTETYEIRAPWETNWALENVDGLIRRTRKAIAARVRNMKGMPGALDPDLAPWLSRPLADVDPKDGESVAAALAALTKFLDEAPTTERAREVKEAIAHGDLTVAFAPSGKAGELVLPTRATFPQLAAELVRLGSERLDRTKDTLEAAVRAAAEALRFLDAKGAPPGVAYGGLYTRAAEHKADPEGLVKVVVDRSVHPNADPAALARVATRALTRDFVRAPSSTAGLSGLVDRAASPAKDHAAP